MQNSNQQQLTRTQIAVIFVHKFVPDATEQECIEKYKIYRSYRDEGQSDLISRQYAGLLVEF